MVCFLLVLQFMSLFALCQEQAKCCQISKCFLLGGGGGGGGGVVMVKSKDGINMYRQEHCSLSTEDLCAFF